ncbi:MAG: DUF6691 family protein [Chloroflexota bacterium]
MFRFEEAHMYLVICSAIVVGALSLWFMKRWQTTTIFHEEITVEDKRFHKGIVFGGVIFGLGWAITGACPGPIYAQIASGEWIAGVTFIFALLGMYLYAFLRPRLPH